jgi:ElaB/YqjD/DUF883 family membrane-anchored ribosome-binding protein
MLVATNNAKVNPLDQTARRVVNDARQATHELAEGTAEKVRQSPLTSVGLAAAAGVVIGGVVGLVYGVFVKRHP